AADVGLGYGDVGFSVIVEVSGSNVAGCAGQSVFVGSTKCAVSVAEGGVDGGARGGGEVELAIFVEVGDQGDFRAYAPDHGILKGAIATASEHADSVASGYKVGDAIAVEIGDGGG